MLCQGLVCPRINVFEVYYLERLLVGPSSLCVSKSLYWFLRCRINVPRNAAHSILVSTWYVPPAPLRFNALKQASKRHLPLPFPCFSLSLSLFSRPRTRIEKKYTIFPQAFCSSTYLIIFHYVHKMICGCCVQHESLLFLLLLLIPFWLCQTAAVWLFISFLFLLWWILMHFHALIDIEWH